MANVKSGSSSSSLFSPFPGSSQADISPDAVDPAGDAGDENRIRPHFKERRQKYSPGCDSSLSRKNTLRLFPAEKSENLWRKKNPNNNNNNNPVNLLLLHR